MQRINKNDLLRKIIPYVQTDGQDSYYAVYLCPVCGAELVYFDDVEIMIFDIQSVGDPCFCPKCRDPKTFENISYDLINGGSDESGE